MSNFRVTEDRDNDGGVYYTVVDSEGYPINDGHFADEADAEYVSCQMETDKFHGDHVSNLCKAQKSWIVK